jgi:formylmethanofuran:tetrahydromethanopterin formyltransferase
MAALLLALSLGGCASTIADLPVVGTPTGVPARPAEAGAYLPVHDMPASRDGTTMAPSEQAKLEKELIAARDRQAVATPAAPAKPAAK